MLVLVLEKDLHGATKSRWELVNHRQSVQGAEGLCCAVQFLPYQADQEANHRLDYLCTHLVALLFTRAEVL